MRGPSGRSGKYQNGFQPESVHESAALRVIAVQSNHFKTLCSNECSWEGDLRKYCLNSIARWARLVVGSPSSECMRCADSAKYIRMLRVPCVSPIGIIPNEGYPTTARETEAGVIPIKPASSRDGQIEDASITEGGTAVWSAH